MTDLRHIAKIVITRPAAGVPHQGKRHGKESGRAARPRARREQGHSLGRRTGRPPGPGERGPVRAP